MYLVALVLIFFSMLIKEKFQEVNQYVEYVYLFFSTMAFTLSFKLPSMLINLQKERIEQEIAERRREQGIRDGEQ
jgi:hypothetical protein